MPSQRFSNFAPSQTAGTGGFEFQSRSALKGLGSTFGLHFGHSKTSTGLGGPGMCGGPGDVRMAYRCGGTPGDGTHDQSRKPRGTHVPWPAGSESYFVHSSRSLGGGRILDKSFIHI